MDRLSRGILDMAAQAETNGALIMYEPSGVAEPRLLKEAVALAHVVSNAEALFAEVERLEPRSGDHGRNPDPGRTRIALSPQALLKAERLDEPSGHRHTPRLVDTCGSGDWLTAGFLAECFRLAPAGLRG